MWVNLLKVVLGLALLGLALSQVQWRDVLDEQDASGQLITHYVGQVTQLQGSTVWLQVTGEPAARPFSLVVAQEGGRWVLRWGLRSSLTRIPGSSLLYASGLYLLAILLASWRWWWLLRLTHLPLSFGNALRLTWVGLFFNTFLPGQTGGDIAKGLYLLKACPQARVPAIGSLVLDRVLGFLGLLLLTFLALFGAQTELGELRVWVWGLFFGGGGVLVLLLSRRMRYWLRHIVRGWMPRALAQRLGHVETALRLYRKSWVALLGCFTLGVINQVCVIFAVALLGRAVGLDLPWVAFFVLLPLLLLVGALPLAPNGWGVGELSFGYLFAAYGASFAPQGGSAVLFYTQGVALSVLFRLLMTAWSLPGGVFWLLWRTPGDVSHAWAEGGRAHE
jgi:uncharacterized membrane protein YbhN (UPF0104 family)